MMLRLILAVAIAGTLAACGDNTRRYALEVAPSASEVRVRTRVRSVLVRSVSLPTYAAAEEIAFRDETGVIRLSKSELWADDPERATTLVISRHLNRMTNATVAPQPWPLEELPEAAVDIRVEQLVATSRGTLQFMGQYFIGGQEIEEDLEIDDQSNPPRRTIRSRSRLFNIEVRLSNAAPGALAVAQSEALRILSEQIARELAR